MIRNRPRALAILVAAVAACVAPLLLSDLTFFVQTVQAATVSAPTATNAPCPRDAWPA